MKVVVNVIGQRIAGGRSVARNLLRALDSDPGRHEFVALAPPDCGYEDLGLQRVELRIVSAAQARSAGPSVPQDEWRDLLIVTYESGTTVGVMNFVICFEEPVVIPPSRARNW